jgi:hypothetical protein
MRAGINPAPAVKEGNNPFLLGHATTVSNNPTQQTRKTKQTKTHPVPTKIRKEVIAIGAHF